MHEYSIVQALLDKVEAEAAARHATSIHAIRVRIGELSGVENDLLRSAYTLFRERTPCEHAELVIEPVPALWSCPGCNQAIERGRILRCPDCDRPARLVEGDEIFLDRIEMEVA